MAVKWLLMNSTPKSCDEAKFEVSFLVLWHVKQSIRLERHRHTHTYTCEYIAFCSRLSQVELSGVLLQIALAFCYVNLFSLFCLFFSYVWSRHERHLKVAEIRNLRPTCVMFTIWGTSIWYTIHIYLVIYVVYPIPNAGPEAATVLGGTRGTCLWGPGKLTWCWWWRWCWCWAETNVTPLSELIDGKWCFEWGEWMNEWMNAIWLWRRGKSLVFQNQIVRGLPKLFAAA